MNWKRIFRVSTAFTFALLAVVAPMVWAEGLDPTQPQLFHTRQGGGGLIEGACQKVTEDDVALVKAIDGGMFAVPLELFEVSEREAIRTSFEIEAPKDALRGEATAHADQHPWHSIRGGVMCHGKIVSVKDDVLQVVDREGELFRIPMNLLAQGAATKAKRDIASLDPSLVTKSKRSRPEASPRDAKAAVAAARKRPENAPENTPGKAPASPPLPPGLAEAIDTIKEKGEPREPPSAAAIGEQLGNLRRWSGNDGKILATGRFLRRTDPTKLTIVDEKGEKREIEYGSLSSDAQIYVQAVEAGAKIDIAADSFAIRREIPAEKLRTWKTMGGIPMASGEFVSLKEGRVTIFMEDQSTRDLPLDLLSAADKQYAAAMASGEGPGKAPDGAFVVSSETARIAPSLDGKSLLLVDGGRLKVLSADGKKAIADRELPPGATQVAERAEYFVAAAGNALVLIDKESFEVIGNHDLWKFQKINDVALHPKRKVAFLSVENAIDEVRASEDERQRVVMVDENTGKANALEGVYAKWLLVDPTGQYLLAGYKDVEERFGGIHVNPDGNVIETPKWENTDILRRYRIEKDGIELDEEFPGAGANGQGLVMSPSGKQIAYLSFTGYPTFSSNIALLDVKNFEKKPVTLATKGIADCKKLAIHPSKPLAASPGGDAVVFFNTQTGKAITKQPPISADLKGCAVEALVFSGDGEHLIVLASKGGGERFVAAIAVGGAASPVAADGADESAEFTAAPGKRKWTDKSRKFRVEAEFAGMNGDNVILKKADGSKVEVPLLKLSAADQVIARKLASEE